jgi:hypothetical protein
VRTGRMADLRLCLLNGGSADAGVLIHGLYLAGNGRPV